jgi:hypothetical protein
MFGERYRLAQAQKLLDLFEAAHGRPASTADELGQWTESPEGRAALAAHQGPDGKINPFSTDAANSRRGETKSSTARALRRHVRQPGRRVAAGKNLKLQSRGTTTPRRECAMKRLA